MKGKIRILLSLGFFFLNLHLHNVFLRATSLVLVGYVSARKFQETEPQCLLCFLSFAVLFDTICLWFVLQDFLKTMCWEFLGVLCGILLAAHNELWSPTDILIYSSGVAA